VYSAEGCSDYDGRLVIGPLRGKVRAQLFAHHDQHRYGAQWVGSKGGTGDQRKAVWVTGKAGVATKIPPLKMDPPGSITGVVRDAATGTPRGYVCAFPYSLGDTLGLDRQVGPHCTNSAGVYTVPGLGPYAWPVLHIAVFQSQYAWHWSGNQPDRFAARYVPVSAGETTTMDVGLVPAGTITGRVITPTGDPAFGYMTAYNARTGDLAAASRSTYDFDTGAYRIGTLATQQVKIEYFVDGASTCWYDSAPDFAAGTAVPVQSGATTTGIDLVECRVDGGS
jgi:hypothetical protein